MERSEKSSLVKYDTIQGERDFRVVERPVGECVRLLNVEDASIFEDIRAVRDACKEILGDEELSTTPSVPGSDSTEEILGEKLSTTPSVRGHHEREMCLANEESDEFS